MASRVLVQADKFGARTAVPKEAVGLRRENGHYHIGLSGGGEVVARSVIAATGARYRRLEVPGLERFEGVSVHYAATEAEVQRCEGEEVAIVGGGNSAGQAALFLAGRTRRVYLLLRGEDLGIVITLHVAAPPGEQPLRANRRGRDGAQRLAAGATRTVARPDLNIVG